MKVFLPAIVAIGLFALPVSAQKPADKTDPQIPANAAIDYQGFVDLTSELQKVRESRRIPIAKFNEMARDPNTIILDTRSKNAFDRVHVDGAVHLNFSDFTAQKLAKVIPSKQTRILIYCNNNFTQAQPTGDRRISRKDQTGNSETLVSERKAPAKEKSDDVEVVRGFTNKAPRLALNIPTFVNLHGYGYKNVYELADHLDVRDRRLKLVGTEVNGRR